MKKKLINVVLGLFAVGVPSLAQESLAPLQNGQTPQTHAELWANYDPRAEPLNVEVLHEWEEDGVVLKVLRYRIGIFKGQKAMMAGVYGYPKSRKNLPGLVQIHGGGQYADYRAPLTNAKRGYATISISWAGRINAPGYRVTPAEVKLFWEGKTNDPAYRVTTDWGALDAYHAPSRNPGNAFAHVRPQAWTLDAVESPRNNPWFLVTLGARRALTFLEQQPDVDKTRLGVYGHSMGGKLTVLTAGADARVKAGAPSCGGVSNRDTDSALYNATIADAIYLKHIDCPVMFQSPSNDFHGRINDLQTALNEISTNRWRVTCSPHHNHQDTPEYEVASQLWFDQHLKETFTFPETPRTAVTLKTEDGIPTASVTLDDSLPVLAVDVHYTRHGQMDGVKDSMENTRNRFWHCAKATREGQVWQASLPLSNTDQPLWVYANVTYALAEPVAYAGYYYRVGSSKAFTLSSRMFMVSADELKAAGVKATRKPSMTIETFETDWKKQWFTYRTEDWGRRTHKIYDEMWKAPPGAKLAFDVLAAQSNKLMVGIDAFATEVALAGGGTWQSVVLAPSDFKDVLGTALTHWQGIRELRLGASETLRKRVDEKMKSLQFGAPWQGPNPKFRKLRWTLGKTEAH